MSFDALTIVGILAAILSGSFLVALVSRNDTATRATRRLIPRSKTRAAIESEP